MLCSHHCCLVPEYSRHPRRKPHTLQAAPPYPTPLFLSLWIQVFCTFPASGITQHLAFVSGFSQLVFQGPLCWGLGQCFLFTAQRYFTARICHSVPSLADRYLGYFYLFIVSEAAVIILVNVVLCELLLPGLLDVSPGVGGLAGLWGSNSV